MENMGRLDRYLVGFIFGMFVVGTESGIFKGWFPYFVIIFCLIVVIVDMVSKPKKDEQIDEN